MVSQYPYSLYQYVTTEAVQNGNGDYVAGSSNWELVGTCRDEANSKGAVIILEDNLAYQFDSLIYLPKGLDFVKPGVQIEVRDGATVRVSGKVRQYMNSQLNTQIWV